MDGGKGRTRLFERKIKQWLTYSLPLEATCRLSGLAGIFKEASISLVAFFLRGSWTKLCLGFSGSGDAEEGSGLGILRA